MEKGTEQGRLITDEDRSPRKRPVSSKRANDLDGATWLRNSISVWDDINKTPEEMSLKHPAMFPSQLVTRLIESFTRSDQKVVLDPFVGIGSTVIAAESLGKTGIGLDVSEEYIAKAERRPRPSPELFATNGNKSVGERRLHVADATQLLEYVAPLSVDFVVTSPPYWDILLQRRTADYKEIRHYGESSADLGRIADYQEFLDALAGIFADVLIALRPGCYCCVVVMDLRKGNKFFPLHSDLSIRMSEIGFLFDDLIIWDRKHEYNNLRPLGHPAVFRINKVHEYILIFQKPWSDGS
jgi:DNA modification methylase